MRTVCSGHGCDSVRAQRDLGVQRSFLETDPLLGLSISKAPGRRLCAGKASRTRVGLEHGVWGGARKAGPLASFLGTS